MKKLHILLLEPDPLISRLIVNDLKNRATTGKISIAQDPFLARDIIVLKNPDLMVMNLTLPRLGGLSFLKQLLSQYPFPVITYNREDLGNRVKKLGAIPFILYRSDHQELFLEELSRLIQKIPGINLKELISSTTLKPINSRYNLIVIGASTGGTDAIKQILTRFPATIPPIAIVQHMPPMFTEMFARNLDKVCQLSIREGRRGDLLKHGEVVIAPGDQHMKLIQNHQKQYQVVCLRGERVSGHRPSVDVLFHSIPDLEPAKTIAILLTGMGRDGADGLLKIKQRGGYTITQDEATSVVYGMPGEAAKQDAQCESLPLHEIYPRVMQLLKESM